MRYAAYSREAQVSSGWHGALHLHDGTIVFIPMDGGDVYVHVPHAEP